MKHESVLVTVVILLLTLSKDAVCQNKACENTTLTIHCKSGEIIQIHYAVYRSSTPSICPNSGRKKEVLEYVHQMRSKPTYSTPAMKKTGRCLATNSLQIVKDASENKSNCSIRAQNDVFEDPVCEEEPKYLEVNYTCEVRPYTCRYDVTNIIGIRLTFNAAVKDEEVNSFEKCPMGSSHPDRHLATRLCTEKWQKPNLRECYDRATLENHLSELAEMNVTDENVEKIANVLAIISRETDDITTDGLENLIKSLNSVVQCGSPSFNVTNCVVGSVNNVMNLNEEILATTPNVSDTILLLEIQLSNVHKNEENYTLIDPNLGVSALQLDEEFFDQGYTFMDHFTTRNSNSKYFHLSTMKSSITLPSSIVSEVKKVYPNVSIIPVSFISYLEPSLFQTNDDVIITDEAASPGSLIVEYIDSHVIAATIELEGVIIDNLPANSSVITWFSTSIITFDLNETNTTVDFECVFWKQPSKGNRGQWSTEGCEKLPSESEDAVTCSCNHLTSFAVLVRVYNTSKDHFVLDVITKIGCIISITGLSFSVMAMVMIRALRQNQQTHVHFNLCLALLGFHLSFLLGIDRAEYPNLCRGMTSLIYFFCISSMSWMSVEAFYIYMLIWKYKRASITNLIRIGVLVAWGLPVVASLLVYLLDNCHDYMDVNQQDYCFLHPGPTLHFGFLLEIFILFLYNLTVFVLSTYRVSCRKIEVANRSDRRAELRARLKSTFLFWVLLGICWVFGFLAPFQSPATALAFKILFCISLSLQGFFMFYMLFVQNPEIKKSLMTKISQTMTSSESAHGNKSSNFKKNEYLEKHTVDMQTNPVSSPSNLYVI